MIRQIRVKLSLYYGLFFSLILFLTAVLIYNRVEQVITQRVDTSLDATSDLIQRIVETGIENRQGEVRKDSFIAQYLLGDSEDLIFRDAESRQVRNIITEEIFMLNLPDMYIGGEKLTGKDNFVKKIQAQTGGEVVLYQNHQEGFVSIQSTLANPRGDIPTGQLIPVGSFIHILMLRENPYYRREYINDEWYLSSYSLLYKEGEIAGAIYVAQKQINMDRLREALFSIKIGREGFPYIIDRSGTVVVHPNLEGRYLTQFQYIVDLVSQRNKKFHYMNSNNESDETEEHVAFLKYIPELNWIVVAGASVNDFYRDLFIIRNILFLIFGVTTVLSLSMGSLIGNRIALPIIRITEKIKEISEGEADFSSHLEVRSADEIGRLAEYFNTFVEKLSNLQELEHREVELMLKDTQMNALQAQINPHFLYNTLETIRFMINAKDIRAVEMVQLLADLFRVSIGKGEVYVDFSQEICHLELYIALQKIRYRDLFEVDFDFPEEIRKLFTLKFILQPILENCITHAFEEVESGGKILIQARKNHGEVHIHIHDNGSGIPEDKLLSIQEQFLGRQKKGSVGLQNVFDRIRLHFGEPFGMDIDSTPGFGTAVNIRVPLLTAVPSKPIVRSALFLKKAERE